MGFDVFFISVCKWNNTLSSLPLKLISIFILCLKQGRSISWRRTSIGRGWGYLVLTMSESATMTLQSRGSTVRRPPPPSRPNARNSGSGFPRTRLPFPTKSPTIPSTLPFRSTIHCCKSGATICRRWRSLWSSRVGNFSVEITTTCGNSYRSC